MTGENHEVETTFLVGLKDAWYTGSSPSAENGERKTFVVAYEYKNLGPREELEPLAWGDVRKEIKTDKGHIFPGNRLCGNSQALFALPEAKRGVFWREKETRKIEETGESATVFEIPKDEMPTEVIAGGRVCGGRIDLDFKLPQGDFGYRSWSPFGFLPRRLETAVPALTEALQYEDKNFKGSGWVLDYSVKHPLRGAALSTLATMGPAAKDTVPTIINVLLYDESRTAREAAAKTLGAIGPAAKEAIPALRNPFQVSHPPNDNGIFDEQLRGGARSHYADRPGWGGDAHVAVWRDAVSKTAVRGLLQPHLAGASGRADVQNAQNPESV